MKAKSTGAALQRNGIWTREGTSDLHTDSPWQGQFWKVSKRKTSAFALGWWDGWEPAPAGSSPTSQPRTSPAGQFLRQESERRLVNAGWADSSFAAGGDSASPAICLALLLLESLARSQTQPEAKRAVSHHHCPPGYSSGSRGQAAQLPGASFSLALEAKCHRKNQWALLFERKLLPELSCHKQAASLGLG